MAPHATYLIGIDEAGYGPNLGPLVVAATAWRVPVGSSDQALYTCFQEHVAPVPRRGDQRLVVADSKAVYRPCGGLAPLERPVRAFLRLHYGDSMPTRWRTLWPAVAGASTPDQFEAPWHEGFDCPLPLADLAESAEVWAARLRGACRQGGVELMTMAASVVHPSEFNQELLRQGGKGAVLSHVSLRLARGILDRLPDDGHVRMCFDRHGGRRRYAALITQYLTDQPIWTQYESPEVSAYCTAGSPRVLDVEFRVGGESRFPTALASMTAKYLRELAMVALNDFWMRRVPGLRPTAGYPRDARRFWRDIRAAQEDLGIQKDIVWRRC